MRFYLFIIFACFFILSELNSFSQSINEACPIEKYIGTEKICLPILSGMTECINKAGVKEYLNSRSSKGKRNIGLYIEDKYLNSISKIESIQLDNYIIVYSTKELENTRITKEYIHILDSFFTTNYKLYINENWSAIKEIVKVQAENLHLDQPVLIEHYYIEKNVPCIITLIRAKEYNIEKVFIIAKVLLEINGKFLAFDWYQNYDGENSLVKLKSNVNYLGLVLSQLNGTNSNNFNQNGDKDKVMLVEAVNYYNSAYKSSNEGKYKESVDLYTKALKLYPIRERIKISEAYINRGINKKALNDFEGAILDYTEAINLRPDYYKGYYLRGLSKLKTKDYKSAIADFSIAINSNNVPNFILASSYGNRGYAKSLIGLNACFDFRKAVELGSETYKPYLIDCK